MNSKVFSQMCRYTCKKGLKTKRINDTMGMAASQARLLTLTARMHDVEYQAQSIQNAKIQLATQSDQVYQNYLEALDATTLTIKDYEGNTIPANFNNLFGIDSVNTKDKYALFDDRGRLVVEKDIATAYNDFKKSGAESDAYAFAMWMLNPNGNNPENIDLTDAEETIAADTTNLSDKSDKLSKIISNLGEQDIKDKSDLQNAIVDAENSGDAGRVKTLQKALDEYNGLEKSYRYKLYQQNAEKVYNKQYGEDGEGFFDQDDFNYYVRMYNEIQQAGGCVSIDEFNGPLNNDASTDGDWLKNQLSSGKFSISIVNTDKKNGDISFSTTSTSTDSSLSETTTSTIDKKALAKAEAEYEHETKKIDQKDKKYDMELSKLETERSALTKEYESVKKVASDNIQRTFGIFS